jgi:glycosyltransferase involved in cell wall biosynthesis
MDRILYIGNFLSQVHGTIGPAVALVERFRESGHNVSKASSRINKVLRIAEMCRKSFFCGYDTIIIDVYSTSALTFANVCSNIAYRRKKKIILTLRGGGLVDTYKTQGHVIDKIFKRASVITTPSVFLQRFFINLGFDVTYIPNTIDIEKFSYVQERPHNHSVLWVRAFTQIYNPNIAVRALAIVKEHYPDATLTMVGPDKGNKEETVILIGKLGLDDSIELTGKIPNEKLPDYYHRHDVYLNTTSYESFGVAVLEAAACGTPIVSTSVGEIPLMWKNNENILLAEKVDEKELAEKICQLFADVELYTSIQENGRRKAEEYAWPSVEAQWEEVLVKDK